MVNSLTRLSCKLSASANCPCAFVTCPCVPHSWVPNRFCGPLVVAAAGVDDSHRLQAAARCGSGLGVRLMALSSRCSSSARSRLCTKMSAGSSSPTVNSCLMVGARPGVGSSGGERGGGGSYSLHAHSSCLWYPTLEGITLRPAAC